MNATDVRRQWAKRSGEYSPEYYAYHGPNETSELIRDTLDRFVGRDASVLELGCSAGRHLSHLCDHGFENLTGIDVNEDAFDVMEEAYPELAGRGTFHLDAIEDAVAEFDDGQFDAVYSVRTLQHLHPDAEWVFEELARIAGELLVTVENEGATSRGETDPGVRYINGEFPLYYRNWNRIFTELGFVEVDARRGEIDTARTFRSAASTGR